MKVCMVIGDPVRHSLSPVMHNAGYKALGIDNEYKYTAKRVKPEDLEQFMRDVREQDIVGVSCTIPHKEAVIPYVDKIDETAKKIGAVNTIVNKNGTLYGYNSDWIGAVEPLKKLRPLKGARVAVMGAGGAGKAFVYGLSKSGAKVTIYNRTAEKAKPLAIQFGCEVLDFDDQARVADAEIICNTTPVGMNSDKSPMNPSYLHRGQIVYDTIYSPLHTRLLKDAKSKGAKTIAGSEMLLYQGFVQFKLFTGRDAPEEAMRKELLKNLHE